MSPQRKRRKPLSEAVKKALKEKADGTRFFMVNLQRFTAKDREHIYLVVQEIQQCKLGLLAE